VLRQRQLRSPGQGQHVDGGVPELLQAFLYRESTDLLECRKWDRQISRWGSAMGAYSSGWRMLSVWDVERRLRGRSRSRSAKT
jgi:hypothetical protein